eukprot:NODE_522_length_1576_cov_278.886706_g398_i0.p1 GENE.NODE_522_length_1576_cov_278.886706_g398_i0~~NODE_522_length_1576_cov_278.886706_g398_i0.p1  ORF type:complete len:398 (+),score=70.04 NODE_522_length_1576_cov_278.886706_g398_i0:101-1294(+)
MLQSRQERLVACCYLTTLLTLILNLHPWQHDIEAVTSVSHVVYPSPAQQEAPEMFRLTFFTTPKACVTPQIATIQRNALRSWAALRPKPTLVVFGDEKGARALAAFVSALHVPNVDRHRPHGVSSENSTLGPPLLGPLFRRAAQVAPADVYVFLNCDILLPQMTIVALSSAFFHFERFLMVLQRFRMNVVENLTFDAEQKWQRNLLRDCMNVSAQHDILRQHRSCILDQANAIDFFAFTANFFTDQLPDFIIGRPVYDNWLLSHALKSGGMVVDATNIVLAIHQNHDYSHVPEGSDYWATAEGAHNRELGLQYGGWSRGDVLHVPWEFAPGCQQVETRVHVRGEEEPLDAVEERHDPAANIYFKKQFDLGPGLQPTHLCALALKRHWTLYYVFAGRV